MTHSIDLVGLAEIGEMFDTSTRQAHRWSKREDFPEPVARLRATPVWLRSDVEEWSEQLPLRPGRRARAVDD